MVELSVIVVTFRDRRDIDCVHLFQKSKFDDYELIVQDDPGISIARNNGIKNATSEKIVFIDDDAVPDPGYLQTAAKALDNHKAVAGKVVHPHNDLFSRLAPYHNEDQPRYVQKFNGCSMAFRREVFNKVGYFNEKFEWGHDEIEFGNRLLQHFPIYYEPKMSVKHHYADSIMDYWKKRYNLGLADDHLHQIREDSHKMQVAKMLNPGAYIHPTIRGTVVKSVGQICQNTGRMVAMRP